MKLLMQIQYGGYNVVEWNYRHGQVLSRLLFTCKIVLNIKYYSYMFGSHSTTPCWNGSSCEYLRNGNCWFYHPPQDMPSQQQDDLDVQIYRPHHRQINIVNRLNRPNPPISSFSFSYLNPPVSVSSQKLDLIINKTSQQKQKWYNYDIHQPTVTLFQQKIPLLPPISSSLPFPKSWYFKNCHHFQYFQQFPHKQCSICIANFEKEEVVTYLYCQHGFHKQCIEKWLEKANCCPLCRKDFRLYGEFKGKEGYVGIGSPGLRGRVTLDMGLGEWSQEEEDNISISFQSQQFDEGDMWEGLEEDYGFQGIGIDDDENW